MNESRRSLFRRSRAFLRHWWTVFNDIVVAVRHILIGIPTRAELVVAELIVGFVLIACLLVAVNCWIAGILNCAYEYDEVARAHWVWLSHQGLRPYHDFFENHPPYQFLLLPVAGWLGDAGDQLTAYRVISGLSIPFLLAGLVANAIVSQGHGLRCHSLWGIAVVSSHPYMMRFLVEFRMDNWAYCIIVWSIYWWRRSVSAFSNNLVLGFCTSIAVFWLCPKLVLLPPILILAAQVTRNWHWGRMLRQSGAYLIGVLAALLLFLLFLWCWRLDPQRVFDLVVRYNWDANKFTSESGVLPAIRGVRPLFNWVVIAAGCLTVLTLWNWGKFDPFYVALISFLVLHAMLVRYPYKQFVAPWFLLSSLLFSHAAHLLYDTHHRIAVTGVVFVICSTAWGSISRCYETSVTWRRDETASVERRMLRELNRITLPSDRVVCAPPLHPVTRYDVFYVSCNSYDVQGRDTEFLLARQGAFGAMVKAEGYRSELNRCPPAIVILDGLYPTCQKKVLHQFVQEAHYETENLCGHRVAVRPDRAGQLGASAQSDFVD
jgi:hypothetical protein